MKTTSFIHFFKTSNMYERCKRTKVMFLTMSMHAYRYNLFIVSTDAVTFEIISEILHIFASPLYGL